MRSQELHGCLQQGSQCSVPAPKIGDLLIIAILGYDLNMKVMPGFDHVFGGEKEEVINWFYSFTQQLISSTV